MDAFGNTTRRSTPAFAVGGIPSYFKCHVCGKPAEVSSDRELDVCPKHCLDHDYDDGFCLYCGDEREYDDEPDYDYSY